jgi:putative DNA primase/helicase
MNLTSYHYAEFARARHALSFLNPQDRESWVKRGICIKSEFGEAGFDLWDEWAQGSNRHNPRDARAVWKSIKGSGKLGIGTLFYDAKAAGWVDDGKHTRCTKAEIEASQAKAAARAEAAAIEEAEEHAKAAARAEALWNDAVSCESHPYLRRKGVQSHGLRVGRWERQDPETGEIVVLTQNGLLVPICDRERQLQSLQCIFPDGTKSYLAGGAKRGNMHCIGSTPRNERGKNVYVLVEGYATGASVHECTGHMVIVCFDTGGLAPVAAMVRSRQPEACIVLAADNDAETGGNPGVRAAVRAALQVDGQLAVPLPGDFNDLHIRHGRDAVSVLIDAAVAAPPVSVVRQQIEQLRGSQT